MIHSHALRVHCSTARTLVSPQIPLLCKSHTALTTSKRLHVVHIQLMGCLEQLLHHKYAVTLIAFKRSLFFMQQLVTLNALGIVDMFEKHGILL